MFNVQGKTADAFASPIWVCCIHYDEQEGKIIFSQNPIDTKSIEENESYFFSTALFVAKIDETDLRFSGLQKCMMYNLGQR